MCVMQAAEEKVRLETIGQGLASKAKDNGNMLQPRWFIADPNREAIDIGEGIRWRYNGKYGSWL